MEEIFFKGSNLSTGNVQLFIILAVVCTGGIYLFWRWRIEKNVQDILVKVMPVWAVFGPYESGYDSAAKHRSQALHLTSPSDIPLEPELCLGFQYELTGSVSPSTHQAALHSIR